VAIGVAAFDFVGKRRRFFIVYLTGDPVMSKFQPGNPGGPGRPRGSRNAMNVLLDKLAAEGAETVVKKMIEVASGGDRVAARMVLNRIWAAPRGRAVTFALPEVRTPADLLEAHAALMAAIAAQTVTPQEGAALAVVLETHRRDFEVVAQQRHIDEIDTELRRLRANLR